MAASSTSASSSSSKVSRFSTTLKAFKFNGNSDKPPPPPPKDGSCYNLNINRSFVSLATESPLSLMNRSAMSLLSDVQSSRSLSPPEAVPPVPAYSQKKRGFFKFGRKSSKGSVESSTSPPPGDEGISLPWNFSASLPPTWTANLANAGFTEEEITAIQNRRQAARSPGPHHLYHNRPASPAFLPTDPVLAYPSPRTTSFHTPDTPITRPPSTSSTSSASSSTDTDTDTDTLRKRLTALPPRLSLHKSKDSTDLTSWGEALLSGISTASGRGSASGPGNVFASAQEARLGFGFGLGLGVGMVSSRGGDRRGGKEEAPMTNRDYYKRAEEKRASQRAQGERKGVNLVPPLNIRSTGANNGSDLDDEDEGDLVDRRGGVEGEDGPSSSVAEPAVTARHDPSATSWDEDDYIVGGDKHEGEVRSVNGRAVGRMRGEGEDEDEDEEDEYEDDEGDCGVSSASPLYKDIEGLLGNSNSSSAAHKRVDDTLSVSPASEPEPSHEDGEGEGGKRESSRSSTSTVLAESATISIARSVSVVRKVGRYVVGRSPVVERRDEAQKKEVEEGGPFGQVHLRSQSQLRTQIHPHSPLRVQSQSNGSQPPPKPTRPAPPLPPSSSPSSSTSESEVSGSGSGSTSANGSENEKEDSTPMPTSATSIVTTTPLPPFHRYPGWLSAIVRPLEEFIDDSIDPREYYLDMQEIAEGESGSVYAARLAHTPAISNLRLPPRVKARDAEDLASGCPTVVAIKSVAILPTGSPKLVDLERELGLMRELMGEGEGQGQGHENVLGMEAVYVDLVEDALWIRMELMERSLADIVELVPSGLILGDRTVARFASDD
ncbi:hypothetical protein C0993_010710 [Termitomyces sp. T159_Od127]|nr:hypothetical protein C0993_010710 [Termitomyces sp. T159_Od127]